MKIKNKQQDEISKRQLELIKVGLNLGGFKFDRDGIYEERINRVLLSNIYSEHKKKLKNLSIKNNKLIICFGAIPGSGKTTISKILEDKYKGVRINTDEIRSIIYKTEIDPVKKQEILENYLLYFLKNYDLINGLIILDCSIDRFYKQIIDYANKNNFSLFVINIQITKETVEDRISKINENYKDYIEEMQRWLKEHKQFEKDVILDITLNGLNPNLKLLFTKLEDKIRGN